MALAVFSCNRGLAVLVLTIRPVIQREFTKNKFNPIALRMAKTLWSFGHLSAIGLNKGIFDMNKIGQTRAPHEWVFTVNDFCPYFLVISSYRPFLS